MDRKVRKRQNPQPTLHNLEKFGGWVGYPNADHKCAGKLYSKKDKGSRGSKRATHEILFTAVNFHFQLWEVPT